MSKRSAPVIESTTKSTLGANDKRYKKPNLVTMVTFHSA